MLPLKNGVRGRTCVSCRKKSSIYAFLSPFSYDDPLIREALHCLKYKRMRGIADVMGELLFEYILSFHIILPPKHILCPVPLAASRRRIRGFNQAELIAVALQKRFGISGIFDPALLAKIKMTRPQVGLSREARQENIKNSFRVPFAEKVRGKDIVLVDDVKTTGATIEEAARVLKEAGAKRVWAITVAH